MKTCFLAALFFTYAALVSCFASAQEMAGAEFSLSSGAEYAEGRYGDTANTHSWYFPQELSADYKNFSGSIIMPYLKEKTPDTSVDPATFETQGGLGDVRAKMSYFLDFLKFDTTLELQGEIKLPTASREKGLGSGKTDITFYAEGSKSFGDFYTFIGLGREFVGINQNQVQNKIWFSSLGAGYDFTEKTGLEFSYDYAQSTSPDYDGSKALTVSLFQDLTNFVSMELYLLAGFSNNSPDQGVGFILTYYLDKSQNNTDRRKN